MQTIFSVYDESHKKTKINLPRFFRDKITSDLSERVWRPFSSVATLTKVCTNTPTVKMGIVSTWMRSSIQKLFSAFSGTFSWTESASLELLVQLSYWKLALYFSRFFSAILVLFLHKKLGFDQDASTAIFHSNEFISYFSPIVGAIIADSWLGHFETLLLMVGVFTVGCTLMFFSAIESLNLPM